MTEKILRNLNLREVTASQLLERYVDIHLEMQDVKKRLIIMGIKEVLLFLSRLKETKSGFNVVQSEAQTLT